MTSHAVWRYFSSFLFLMGTASQRLDRAVGQSSQPVAGALVHQIDHIVIDSDNPEIIFRFFLDKLQLPLGWPYRSYGTFSSGGVGLGNVIVEFVHLKELHPGVAGVAFEPTSMVEAVTGLDARGVKHGPAEPVSQPDSSGTKRLAWTTMDLNLPADGLFLCKYVSSVEPRRARIRQELQARDGGPLGIDSVVEVVVGVRDLAAAQADFRRLLGPSRTGEAYVWAVGDGPALCLVSDKEDHVALVRVKVKSLERARAYLKSENMLGEDTGSEVSLSPARLGTTNMQFVQ